MANFRHQIEIHGDRIGLTEQNELVVKARPIGEVSRYRRVEWFDDFIGDTINTTYAGVAGSDPQALVAACIAGSVGGQAKIVTGDDATTTMAVNGAQFGSSLNFSSASGLLMMETRIKISAITDISLFVGFTDRASGTLEMPIQSNASGNTLISTATDAVGFMFDTAMTTDNIWAVGVDSDVDATAVNTGLAFVADTFKVLRVELASDGVAMFYIDGTAVARLTGACGNDVPLTPYIGGFSLGAASRDITWDYLHVTQDRV